MRLSRRLQALELDHTPFQPLLLLTVHVQCLHKLGRDECFGGSYKALRRAPACSVEVRRPTTTHHDLPPAASRERSLHMGYPRMCRGASSSSSASPFGGFGLAALAPSSAVAEPVLGQERPRARACPEPSAAVRRLNRDLVSGDADELCLQGASSGSGLFGGAR